MAPIVMTSYGELEGIDRGTSLVFKGIPFSQPPVGALRWRPPEPPTSWEGVRDATASSGISPQVVNAALEALLPSSDAAVSQSEDCLYLNIHTPAIDEAKRPTLVWIHGGAFTTGSGSSPLYNGTALAERGEVVVVTINYRLGALGFLALPGSTENEPQTNFGMLDQVAALRWVQQEIAAFGGDPGNVTIFGESAGGMSVGCLMGSPLATGLFHKAILQSGAGHHALFPETANATTARFLELTGCDAHDRPGLEALSVEQILAAQAVLEEALMESLASGEPLEMWAQPVVDRHFLAERPVDAIRNGSAPTVAVLIGTTAEESGLFVGMAQGPPPDDNSLKDMFESRLQGGPEVAADAIAAYRAARAANGEGTLNHDLYVAVDTDFMFRIPAERMAEAQVLHGAPTFCYRLDYQSPALGGALGACHALDLPFVFDTHGLMPMFAGSGSGPERLAEQVMDAWLAFARTGNPSTETLCWPAYDAEQRQTMILNVESHVESRPRETERQCWEGRR